MNAYSGPMPQEQLQAQRENYTTIPGPVMEAYYAVEAKGKYARMPIFLDVSHWNAKVVNGTKIPVTDWKYLASKAEYFGAYVKCGEAFGVAASGSQACDGWFDVLCDSHVQGLYDTGGWIGLYEMYEPAWAINRGINMSGISNMFKGATDDIIAQQLLMDPNIYIFARKSKRGIGREITAEKMRTFPNGIQDELVIDLEKWYTTSGAVVADNWMGFALRNTIDGLRWLMNHGYMKQQRIVIYTSNWFLTTYGNRETRQVCDENSTICAGYYWDPNKIGTKPVTWEELLADLATIPDAWHPTYVGREVFGLQVSGDYFKMFGSAQDINCCKLTWAELEARYPLWKARREAYQGGAMPPPVDPPPVVVPKSGVVVSTAGVRMRARPSTNAAVFGVLPKDWMVDVEEIALAGNEQWVRIARDLWCCAKQGNTTLINLK